MALADLKVRIMADTTDFEKSMTKVRKSFSATSSMLQNAGSVLTAAVSLPLLGIGVAATKMAMDAVESENLFEVSMKGMADTARAWSEKLRKELGLNSFELRKNVGTFNTMFMSMGLGTDKAYELSTGLTQLAYDMASFFNLRPEEAFDKLRSGIVGQVEPLRALGISVDEATVKAYAYKNGIAAQGAELTAQQKILARYGVILAQTSDAQGDLARTIDSPTNKLRVLKERLKETAIEMGMSLLPTMQTLLDAATPFVNGLGKVAEGFNKLDPGMKQAIVNFAGFLIILGPTLKLGGMIAGAIAKLIPLFSRLVPAITGAWAALQGLGAVIAANPIGALIVLIGVLIAVTVTLWRNWDRIGPKLVAIWGDMKEKAYAALSWILTWLEKLTAFLPSVSRAIGRFRDDVNAAWQTEQALQQQRAWNASAMGDFRKAEQALEKQVAAQTKNAPDAKDPFDGFKPSVEAAAAVVDIFAYKLGRLQAAWQLFTLTTNLSETSQAFLAKQQENLASQLQLVSDHLSLVQEQYLNSANTTGLFSAATVELGQKFDELRIKQAELQRQIEDTTKAMQHQLQIKDGMAYVDIGGAYLGVPLGTPGPDAIDINQYGPGWQEHGGTTINATINVNGAKSPTDTAAAVAAELNRQRLSS